MVLTFPCTPTIPRTASKISITASSTSPMTAKGGRFAARSWEHRRIICMVYGIDFRVHHNQHRSQPGQFDGSAEIQAFGANGNGRSVCVAVGQSGVKQPGL